MGKVLVLAGLALIVWWMWRKLQQAPRDAGATPGRPPELMVACARCGVNQPRSECVKSAVVPGRYFCSDAHRREAEPDR